MNKCNHICAGCKRRHEHKNIHAHRHTETLWQCVRVVFSSSTFLHLVNVVLMVCLPAWLPACTCYCFSCDFLILFHIGNFMKSVHYYTWQIKCTACCMSVAVCYHAAIVDVRCSHLWHVYSFSLCISHFFFVLSLMPVVCKQHRSHVHLCINRHKQ